MFDLYELKISIKVEMKNLDIVSEEDDEDREKVFVKSVRQIHANLSNMEEKQLQSYLKT